MYTAGTSIAARAETVEAPLLWYGPNLIHVGKYLKCKRASEIHQRHSAHGNNPTHDRYYVLRTHLVQVHGIHPSVLGSRSHEITRPGQNGTQRLLPYLLRLLLTPKLH